MKLNGWDIVKKIIGFLAILFIALLTLRFIKMMPAFMKALFFMADVFAIYWVYTGLIKNKNKNEKQAENEQAD